MDNDQFVPIKTVANFNLVKKMTNDIDLIVQLYRGLTIVEHFLKFENASLSLVFQNRL